MLSIASVRRLVLSRICKSNRYKLVSSQYAITRCIMKTHPTDGVSGFSLLILQFNLTITRVPNSQPIVAANISVYLKGC